MATVSKKRIWGWMSFDWASQPFYTLGLTFVFGPYFAVVAAEHFMGTGLEEGAAKAQAQSLWSAGQTIAGLFIAFTAPFLGAFADNSGRKVPWIVLFSIIYVIATTSLWMLEPSGTALILVLVLFYVGFIAAESSLNFVNAILPSLGTKEEVGRISGSGAAFGYWGGVVALAIMLLLFVEQDNGKTIFVNLDPMFGLDAAEKEGTRFVGPFIAIWYAVFMIPFFLFVRDDPKAGGKTTSLGAVAGDLWGTLKSVAQRKSLLNFLVGSMFYRDALNALYAFGGVYAALVLDWSVTQIGVFGVVAAIAAAVTTWAAGLADRRFGPKPVIRVAVWCLIIVSLTIVFMSREQVYWIALPIGSTLPDTIFYICGAVIGGAGGAVYSASRSMMVRHTHPDRPAEAFGLFALSGKATAFLAPAGITFFTWMTGNTQLGFLPVIFLFLIGLVLLWWVKPEGDADEWAAHES
ncbi:MFS transporter [Pseudooctadecabacter jejudonensis]|uniref:Vacuole effluxer Atg22 like protein n=1 Tax=Pseudooctadecabacter jejudonensis TaxID=1391910 RepID=A0A1Y5S2U5_9RHOB|nr:MFS transporter [Pseudooctadecabacter jejudonensis]SLN31362.1 Vacuole effluxer Atg22 like protein [Pseudooctadecabacter jejudonensis]